MGANSGWAEGDDPVPVVVDVVAVAVAVAVLVVAADVAVDTKGAASAISTAAANVCADRTNQTDRPCRRIGRRLVSGTAKAWQPS
jgi:hypothetical protein